MESVPEDIDFEKVKDNIGKLFKCRRANDIHIWQTDSNSRFLSAHLEIENVENGERNKLLSEIQKKLLTDFKINHTTIQMVSATEAEKIEAELRTLQLKKLTVNHYVLSYSTFCRLADLFSFRYRSKNACWQARSIFSFLTRSKYSCFCL